MNKKGFLQISFPWIFAIIVGIFILFLTIYGITKLIGTQETVQDVKTSREIGILLNPLETSFEEGKTLSLGFPVDTRIFNLCNDIGDFGQQVIQVSQKSFNKWTRTSIDISFPNKYIFSKDPVEGRDMNVFAKPFDFPFKVTDLIYIIPVNDIYCFHNAPEDVEDDIDRLNLENLMIENCSDKKDVINVCFGSVTGVDCRVDVSYGSGYLTKSGATGNMYFTNDALMFGAIFSEKDVYECQVQRLMNRVAILSELYVDKANFISFRVCDTVLNTDLQLLASSAKAISSSSGLFTLQTMVEDLERRNSNALCRLW